MTGKTKPIEEGVSRKDVGKIRFDGGKATVIASPHEY
jgi:hypothetical protein